MISPQTPPQPNKSRYRPIGLTLVAGVLLAWGSCCGFLQTMTYNSPFPLLTALGFFLGVVLFLTGFIGTIIWAIKRIARGAQERP